MSYRYELSVDHNKYDGMTVWDIFEDDTPAGWKVTANEGFVFYDPTVEVPSTLDPVTGEEIPGEIYYTRLRYVSQYRDWSKFNLVAVREDIEKKGCVLT